MSINRGVNLYNQRETIDINKILQYTTTNIDASICENNLNIPIILNSITATSNSTKTKDTNSDEIIKTSEFIENVEPIINEVEPIINKVEPNTNLLSINDIMINNLQENKELMDDISAKEIIVNAAYTEEEINKLSTGVRAELVLVNSENLHQHKKYTHLVEVIQSIINLPINEKYSLYNDNEYNNVSQDTLQIYVNGILQSNGINFTEIADIEDNTKGIGVDFSPEQLIPGDVVTFEWVAKNVIMI